MNDEAAGHTGEGGTDITCGVVVGGKDTMGSEEELTVVPSLGPVNPTDSQCGIWSSDGRG